MTKRIDKRLGLHGFTLIELLVVIAIIGVLAALLLGGIQAVRDAARRKKALTQERTLMHAIKTYRTDYDSWPGQQGEVDKSYSDLTDIMAALTNNPRQILYIETMGFSLTNQNGELHCLDPWQRPYIVTMDESGDEMVEVQITTPVNLSTDINDTVAVVSWGQKLDDNNEDKRVFSWR